MLPLSLTTAAYRLRPLLSSSSSDLARSTHLTVTSPTMAYNYPVQHAAYPPHSAPHVQPAYPIQPPQPPHDPFRAYYAERLRALTFNSRPLIQDLSMQAMAQRDQHNWAAMKAVVEEIESAVLRVCLRLSRPTI